MKKKIKNLGINHIIYLLLLLLPFLLIGFYSVSISHSSASLTFSNYMNAFSSIFGNFGFIQSAIIDILSHFEVDTSSFIIVFMSQYLSYFIIMTLIHIVVDLLLFLPNYLLEVLPNE